MPKNNIPLAKQEVRRVRSTASTVLSSSTVHHIDSFDGGQQRIEEGIVLSPTTSSSSPSPSDSNEETGQYINKRRRKVIIAVVLFVSLLAIVAGVVSIVMFKNSSKSQHDSATVIDESTTSVELEATYDDADVSVETTEVIPSAPSPPLFFDPPDTTNTTTNNGNNQENQLATTTSSPSLSPTTTDPPSSSSPTTSNPTTISPTSTAPTSSSPTSASPIDEPIVYDAIIIGAGWSGLRAAHVLSDSIDDAKVLILEANDYIGGRSKTVMTNDGSMPTDLGSEWLYADWNTMSPELIDGGFIDAATENDLNTLAVGDEGSVYYSQQMNEDGSVGTAMLVEDGFKLQSSLWEEFMDFKKDILKDQDDISYEDALEQFLGSNSFLNEEIQLLNLLLDMGETEYSGEIDEISVKELQFWFMEGCTEESYYMAVPGVGFGNTAIAYSDGIDAEFSLNSKVTDINYEDDNNVIVSYEENGETKKVEAKSALVTVSLGVLQAKTISFTPELPESKVDAIDNMGFGDMNKIVLYWNNEDAIVWPDKYWFRLVTTSDETSGMFTTWFNPTLLKGVPCLVGWISGDEAEDIEDETDEVILEQAMMQLKSMFPSISEPDTVIISRWGEYFWSQNCHCMLTLYDSLILFHYEYIFHV